MNNAENYGTADPAQALPQPDDFGKQISTNVHLRESALTSETPLYRHMDYFPMADDPAGAVGKHFAVRRDPSADTDVSSRRATRSINGGALG